MDEGLPIVPCGNGICKALTPYICSTMKHKILLFLFILQVFGAIGLCLLSLCAAWHHDLSEAAAWACAGTYAFFDLFGKP